MNAMNSSTVPDGGATSSGATAQEILASIRGKLIVSCQAYPGEPMRDSRTMAQVAQSVVSGGARAVRAQGLSDITAIAAVIDVPVVGLWKDGDDSVYITPTLRHALAVAQAGADIVALDGTRRPRPDGLSFADTVKAFRQESSALLMADCGSADDARMAADAGVDLVGTTLAGYSGERAKSIGPDLELVDQIVSSCQVPVIVEGRVHTPAQAAEAMARGAWSVCVGTAITHPETITTWFVDTLTTS